MATKNEKTGKKRGRTHLTQADKEHMAERRIAAVTEKQDAENALLHNPQFRNPKFWGTIAPDVSAAVVDAIAKGGEKAKQNEIKALEAKLATLRGPQSA
jgi:hypothetical protein